MEQQAEEKAEKKYENQNQEEIKEEEIKKEDVLEDEQNFDENEDVDEGEPEVEVVNEEETGDEEETEEDITLEEKVEILKEEVDELEEEKDKYKNQLQRLKADFINYRKRMKKEKQGIELQAKIEILEEILPVIDNFERALSSKEDQGEFKEGVEMIHRQLLSSLKQTGLEEITSEGEEFDTKYHEAIMQVEDADADSGMVVEELQKGYIFEDKVIRPAMVKVAE